MDLSDDYEGSEDPSHSYGGGGDYSMEESSQSVDDISSDARSFSNYSELNTDQFSEENASFEHDVSDESNSGTESSDFHNEDHEEGSFPMPGSFFPGEGQQMYRVSQARITANEMRFPIFYLNYSI